MNASGVKVYILDTGIQGTHTEFSGMIDSSSTCHGDFVNEGNPLSDGHGHGYVICTTYDMYILCHVNHNLTVLFFSTLNTLISTSIRTHVAGTTVGSTYGVSYCSLAGNNCELCAVKVLNSRGSSSGSSVTVGIDHVVGDCAAGEKCVGNMSLGGGLSSFLNQAVADAVNAGVIMVVAAGNENQNACNASPASEPLAITVGSTTSSDARSGFSNYGSCVDVWAPGSDITSAMRGTDSNTATWSGTSMASPRK